MSDLRVGTTIIVKPGVAAPDLPEFCIEGWIGQITKVGGKKAARKYFVEWDDGTISGMSTEYLSTCESRQLYHRMMCLTDDLIEVQE